MITVVPYRDCIANAKSCLLRPTNISLGIAVIVLSSILFAPTSQTATKFLAGTFPLWQILFFRSLGQTAWMLVFFWPTERGNLFRTRYLGTHLARSTLLTANCDYHCALRRLRAQPVLVSPHQLLTRDRDLTKFFADILLVFFQRKSRCVQKRTSASQNATLSEYLLIRILT